MSIVTVLVLCITAVVLAAVCAWRHDQCLLRSRLTRHLAVGAPKSTKIRASHSNEVLDC
jgi:hypothetical protein